MKRISNILPTVNFASFPFGRGGFGSSSTKLSFLNSFRLSICFFRNFYSFLLLNIAICRNSGFTHYCFNTNNKGITFTLQSQEE